MIPVSAAYQGVGAAWAGGAALLYDRLAEAIVAPFHGEMRGKLVLDVGVGAGALCTVLTAAGARPVALDAAADMLQHASSRAWPGVVGDMLALPFGEARFGAAFAGFSVSHVGDPGRALAEMRRVVAPKGLVVAAVFAKVPRNASKEIVDAVAAEYGFVPPSWYVELKTRAEPLTNTPELLRAHAAAAGLDAIEIADLVVETGVSAPDAIVASRLGMAHLAPFAASLDHEQRAAFIRQATDAVAERGQPLRPRVLTLSSRVPVR